MGEMLEQTDAQLLRDYAEHRNETAFRELVHRHADVVYASALRQVSSPDLAHDIAQSVFTDLARKAQPLAGTLTVDASLLGWLYRSTRFLVFNQLRDDRRRQARERQAMENFDPASQTAPEWERVQPVLDEAMAELSDEDRDALLLRFFKNRDFRAIGASLGVSDDAAQKRVSRALERLRTQLTSRGVTTSAVTFSSVLLTNAVPMAPAGLAATLSTAALAGTTLATTATATALKTIAMTTLQKTVVTATIAVAVGAGIYEARQASTLREQNQALQQQNAPLAEQLQQLRREHEDAARTLASLREDNERLNHNTAELLKLRGEVTRLKTAAAQAQNNPTEAAMKSWLGRVSQLKERLEQMPDKRIPELQFLKETDWLDTVRDMNVDTEIEARQALRALRNVAKEKVASVISEALKKYLKANDGKFPAEVAHLRPYCEPPIDDSILERYAVLPATDVTNTGLTSRNPDWLIAEKAPADADYDTRFVIGAVARGRTDFDADILIPVVRAFQSANNGQQLGDPYRLLPYAQTPEQQRALQKWIQRFSSLQQ